MINYCLLLLGVRKYSEERFLCYIRLSFSFCTLPRANRGEHTSPGVYTELRVNVSSVSPASPSTRDEYSGHPGILLALNGLILYLFRRKVMLSFKLGFKDSMKLPSFCVGNCSISLVVLDLRLIITFANSSSNIESTLSEAVLENTGFTCIGKSRAGCNLLTEGLSGGYVAFILCLYSREL